MASTIATAVASPPVTWNHGMTSRLKDDDPRLPQEVLKARLKQRAKLARRQERAVTGQAPLVGGRPPKGNEDVKPDTLQRRKRKAASMVANEVALNLMDVGLPDFAVGMQPMAAEAERMAVESRAAAESAAAERAATEAAAEAAAEAAIEAAATEAAAAEIEAAIE